MAVKTIQKLEVNTKAFIVQAIKDIVSDPDFGLQLTAQAVKRLEQAQTRKGKTISLSALKKKYY